ncbi:hypothetical protein ORG37_25625 [Rahnella perminowiae]|uniref:Topoisomerase II n=1 Tax=Rahnella perminowiae TaxID=2816244 RepID=A0ABS6KXI9_9GAMM|nr:MULTISPECIES: hypothetical protein [Rahnella]MBU9834309.1 hypothetical protein [Rahnella perminowiae]MCX2946459.1 hypothetical protein [Rahnella perminowiae]
MNWNEVMVWGISGAVMGSLIGALHKKGKIGRVPAVTLFLVLIIGGNLLWGGVIKPRLAGNSEEQKIDQALAALPLYNTIRMQEPALYAQIRSHILTMKKEGKPQQEAIDTVKPMVSALLSQRISHAPDANVNQAMQVNLEEMQTLQARKDGSCFKFLYPQVSGGVNTAQVLPPELFRKDLDTMNDLLLATGSGQTAMPAPVSTEKVVQMMAPVREALASMYGEQLQMFNDLTQPDVDREKVCEISVSLYSGILALRPAESAAILRMMLGKNN